MTPLTDYGFVDPLPIDQSLHIMFTNKVKEKRKMEKEQAKFEIKGKIELPTLDLDQYIGKRVTIATIEQCVSEFKGKPSYYVKVITTPVDNIKNSDGEDTPLTASLILGLQKDVDGNIGWGENTKTGKYLKLMKVKDLDSLKGEEVIVQLTKPNEDGKQFLTF